MSPCPRNLVDAELTGGRIMESGCWTPGKVLVGVRQPGPQRPRTPSIHPLADCEVGVPAVSRSLWKSRRSSGGHGSYSSQATCCKCDSSTLAMSFHPSIFRSVICPVAKSA